MILRYQKQESSLWATQNLPCCVPYISGCYLSSSSFRTKKFNNIHQHNNRNASNFDLSLHHLSLSGRKPLYKGAIPVLQLAAGLIETTSTKTLQNRSDSTEQELNSSWPLCCKPLSRFSSTLMLHCFCCVLFFKLNNKTDLIPKTELSLLWNNPFRYTVCNLSNRNGLRKLNE